MSNVRVCSCGDIRNHPGGEACTCDDYSTCDACIDAGIFDGIFDFDLTFTQDAPPEPQLDSPPETP